MRGVSRVVTSLTGIASVTVAVGTVCLAAAGPAHADPMVSTASAALGVGAFGARPDSTIDLGVDLAQGEWTLGLGGRARFLAGEGFRTADWNERSEWAGVVRYATWTRVARAPGATSASVAVGPLAGVRLGHGALVDGYTAGLDVDHARTGVAARTVSAELDTELLVDDVTAPRIFAGRGAWKVDGAWRLGATAALDRTAPDRSTLASTADDTTPLVLLGADAEWDAPANPTHGLAWALTADLAGALGVGGGLHLGARAAWLDDGIPAATLTVEARAGTSGWLPGYISPLYELERGAFFLEHAPVSTPGAPALGVSQLATVRAGGFGGLGERVELVLARPSLGRSTFAYARRAGTRDLMTARLTLPDWHAAQLGAWLAVEPAVSGDPMSVTTGAAAAEARVRLPSHLYVTAELARLYRDDPPRGDGRLAPLWIGTISVGAVLGE